MGGQKGGSGLLAEPSPSSSSSPPPRAATAEDVSGGGQTMGVVEYVNFLSKSECVLLSHASDTFNFIR